MAVDVEGLKQQVRDRARVICEDARDLTLTIVKGAAPAGETGVLADSIEVDDVVEVDDGVFSTRIRATAPYASITDTGHGEWVQAGSPVLSFAWPGDPRGRERSAFRSVTHLAEEGKNWFSEPMPDTWDNAVVEAAN